MNIREIRKVRIDLVGATDSPTWHRVYSYRMLERLKIRYSTKTPQNYRVA